MFLVTGGGGFLGLYVVEHLVARGDKVRVFCRGHYPEIDKLGVETFNGDLLCPETLNAACVDVDAVIHTAAVPGISVHWQPYYETNTLGTERLLDACKRQGVQRFVFTSSPSVTFDIPDQCGTDEIHSPYPKHFLGHYAHSKALAEQAVLAANCDTLRTCSLRPHLLWGPRDRQILPRVIARAKAGKLFRVGDGTNLVDTVYVENAAIAHLQAADALTPGSPVAGNAYFLSQGEPVNAWKWVDELLALVDLPPVKRAVSYRFAYATGTMLEVWYKLFGLKSEPVMTRFLASQLARSHYFDITAAKRDFGYSPKIDMKEGMSRLAKDLKTRIMNESAMVVPFK
jgi:nucleoside-diphosphate-sugar epimerase